MFSPKRTPRHRKGGFPFASKTVCCQYRYPIATQSVPQSHICPFDSLGDFHGSFPQFYPLLQTDFQDNITAGQGHDRTARSLSLPTCSRKAGYTAHSDHGIRRLHRIAGSYPVSYRGRNTALGVRRCTIAGLHSRRVRPLMPLRAARKPQAITRLPPASPPDWA